MDYRHNKFWKYVMMIAMVIGMIHGIGQSALAVESSENISGLTSSGYNSNFSRSGTHFTVSGSAFAKGISIQGTKATVTAINSETISRIEFTISDYNTALGYGTITASTGTVTASGLTITISNINTNTVNFSSNSSGSVFFDSITIYYDAPESYTITIPSTLTVSNTGWNALDGGISVDLTLASDKTLIVTATSSNDFKFVKSGDSTATVAYYFFEGGDSTTEYNSSDAKISWNFSASGSKDIGIVVEDYSSKPAGTYTETVTFTANVKETIVTLTDSTTQWEDGMTYIAASDLTINNEVTVNGNVNLILNDGVTLTVKDDITGITGITVNKGAALTISGQTSGTGKLSVNGDITIYNNGALVVNGGDINATGSNGDDAFDDGTGYYNGGNGYSGIFLYGNATLTVNGGTVTATGGNGGSGINDGDGGDGGEGIVGETITVKGGTLTLIGGDGGSGGSSGGSSGSDGWSVNGTITTTLSIQGSNDNSTWTDATLDYENYKYVIVRANTPN